MDEPEYTIYDPNAQQLVPLDDLRRVEAQRDRLRAALGEALGLMRHRRTIRVASAAETWMIPQLEAALAEVDAAEQPTETGADEEGE